MPFERRVRKLRQTTQDAMKSCREKIRRIKVQIELNLAAAVKTIKMFLQIHEQQMVC